MAAIADALAARSQDLRRLEQRRRVQATCRRRLVKLTRASVDARQPLHRASMRAMQAPQVMPSTARSIAERAVARPAWHTARGRAPRAHGSRCVTGHASVERDPAARAEHARRRRGTRSTIKFPLARLRRRRSPRERRRRRSRRSGNRTVEPRSRPDARAAPCAVSPVSGAPLRVARGDVEHGFAGADRATSLPSTCQCSASCALRRGDLAA